MTLRTLLLIIFLLAVQTGIAQDLRMSATWGAELRASKHSSLSDLIGYDATGIYAVNRQSHSALGGGDHYTLDHYDNNFAQTQRFELDLKQDGYPCEVHYVLHLKGKIYVFYSYKNKIEKKKYLFVDEIDKTTLRTRGRVVKLGTIDYAGNSNRNSGTFSFKVSRDSSKVLAVYYLPFEKDEFETFDLAVLDSDLKPLWQKRCTLPYKDGLFQFEAGRVDDTGNVYVLGMVFKEKAKTKRNGKPNYTYEAFAYSDKGNVMKQYSISLPDKFITDMQIEILHDNLVCAGFYSANGTFSIRGTYFLTVDIASKEIKTRSFKEFGIDFITQNMKESEVRKTQKKEAIGKDPELYEYDLHDLLVGRDGSAVLIGEQYYVKVFTYSGAGGRTYNTVYHYYYNDIIAVKISPQGQIEWAQKIGKTQHTTNDDGFYSSYALAVTHGRLCFIFNDRAENIDYGGQGRPKNVNPKNSIVVVVALDKDGNQTKNPVFNVGEAEVIVRPKVCEQIANNEMVLFGQRGKNQQFALLKFE